MYFFKYSRVSNFWESFEAKASIHMDVALAISIKGATYKTCVDKIRSPKIAKAPNGRM